MEDRTLNEHLIIEMVKEKRQIWKKGSGRNLFAALQPNIKEHSIKLGRDKFFTILRENGLLIQNKKRKAMTTNSYHHYHKYPNIIKGIIPLKAGEIIVSDITYVWIENIENFAYLFLITDVYSRMIIGHCLCDNLKAVSAIEALKMALAKISTSEKCIHHSDRGVQYCCHQYTKILEKNKMQISMTNNGDPLENAIAERVNKTIKEEFTDQKEISFKTLAHAKREMPTFIKFYNEGRPHRSIAMHTPAEAFNMTGELKRKWKAYYKKQQPGQEHAGDFF